MVINKEIILVNNKRRDELLGREFETNRFGKYFIIDYKNNSNVLVMFYEPFCIVKCRLNNLKEGRVANPMYLSVQGVGCYGVGKYSSKDREVHKLWYSLLDRCYGKDSEIKFPTYKDVIVCKEWLNFQNFAAWCYDQKFFKCRDGKGKSYHLDKDILVKGNKMYSPDTCCFVPCEINSSLTLSNAKRGLYPLGVSFDKDSNKFKSSLLVEGVLKNLGRFNTPEEAFEAYKRGKEDRLKFLARKWEGRVDDKVLSSLLSWEMCIDD